MTYELHFEKIDLIACKPIFKETWIDRFTVIVEGLTPEAVEAIEEYKANITEAFGPPKGGPKQ